jgi:hypothetical protein
MSTVIRLDGMPDVRNLQYPDIHRILKFSFGYSTQKWDTEFSDGILEL